MHGQTSEESKLGQCRMRPVPCQLPATGTISNPSKYFSKDHQEEVDQLLERTNQEMQASGVPSPISRTGSTSSHHPNMPFEAVQNIALHTASKRKRERIDHGSDSSKREQAMKINDSDISHPKWEPLLKPSEEYATIIDKDGGLLNLSSVDQLVHIMQQDCNDTGKNAYEVSRRIMLSGIIAATEKEECLDQFVQLGGLPMLNDWLQEAHKGKDGGSPKEGDKGCEELLLTLLQALYRLPIDLDALKKCIVGKSVNNLRNHKNIEVQKKARKLVDTWKKRVDAEMKMSSDLKVLSNAASKPPPADPAHVSQMKLVAASEVTPKTIKTVANSSNLEDNAMKRVSDYVSGAKQHIAVGSKSAFAVSVGAKVASTMMFNSITSGKGHSLSSATAQKEPAGGKSPASAKATASQEKVSCSVSEKGSPENARTENNQKGSPDNVRTENVNSQKLIVRLPNPLRSVVLTASGGSMMDLTASSKGSPTSLPAEKVKMLISSEISSCLDDANIVTGVPSSGKSDLASGHGKKRLLPVIPVDYAENRSVDLAHIPDVESADGKKGLFSSGGSTSIDTCPTGSRNSIVDANEAGLDLLTSVASKGSSAGEEYNTDTSTERSITRTIEGKGEAKSLIGADRPLILSQNVGDMENIVSDEGKKEKHDGSGVFAKTLSRDAESAILPSSDTVSMIKTDNKHVGTSKENGMVAKGTEGGMPPLERHSTKTEDLDGIVNNIENGDLMCKDVTTYMVIEDNLSSADKGCQQEREANAYIETTVFKQGSVEDAEMPGKVSISSMVVVPRAADVTCPYSGEIGEQQVAEEVESAEQEALPTGKTEGFETDAKKDDTGIEVEKPRKTELSTFSNPDDCQEVITDRGKSIVAKTKLGGAEGKEFVQFADTSSNGNEINLTQDSMLSKSVDSFEMGGRADEHSISEQEREITSGISTDKTIEVEETAKKFNDGQITGLESSPRPLFDLNEGLDESPPVSLMAFMGPSSLPSLVSTSLLTSSALAAPIAVVAATKGLFIPPSDSFLCKAELGWKGSAVSSAFRPAEPRRTAERLQCSVDLSVSNSRSDLKWLEHFEIDLNTVNEKFSEDMEAEPLQRSSLNLDVHATSSSSAQVIAPFANETQITANTCYPVTRLELDLNQADGILESAAPLVADFLGAKMATSSISNSFSHFASCFDLNDGPSLENATGNEAVSWSSCKNVVMSTLPTCPGTKFNQEVDVPAWFPSSQSSSKPAMLAFPPLNPVAAAGGVSSVKPFACRADTLLPSFPAPSYTTSTPADLSYTQFTLQSTLPLAPSFFVNSKGQYVDSSSSKPNPAVPSQLSDISRYGRSCRMGIPDASENSSNARWNRAGLDLNSGPEVVDLDAGHEGTIARQGHGFGQVAFQHPGLAVGAAKRKEPENGLDPFRHGYKKQMMWQ